MQTEAPCTLYTRTGGRPASEGYVVRARDNHTLTRDNHIGDDSLFIWQIIFLGILNTLKVPKREIFDRSDFPDFYTIKSLREGDFGVKIKKIKIKYLGVHLGPPNSLRVCSV